ncbi:hypothetical protein GG681_08630 [Epibacterium sp. SM1969]|uniref:Type IV pilus biogenesis n=1 Tax=Tritonibacter aquimaris TaxID=2663379 RepID=A0A844ASJ9_9RHOB|nr:hypothetical protein [Tritonibacter aquimaris]MQY42707.1 hypothetical protein [Tritonibacter aquimaris]
MKPDFALSLSSQGITLLLRAAGGWRSIGQVAFDVADLDAALADLRTAGEAYGLPLACKLILPNDQIRYLSVETGEIAPDARRAQAGAAVAEATPYALDELAFDISADGGITHVAAVAHETLEEARGFANAHGFTPTSFVAIPGEQAFLGEPFFGAANADNDVIPDGIAVVDLGPASPPPSPALEEELAPASVQEAPTKAETKPQEPEAPAPSAQATKLEEIASRAAAALARDDLPDHVSATAPTGLPETLDFSAIDTLAERTSDIVTADASAPKASEAAVNTTDATKQKAANEAPEGQTQVGFVSRRANRPDHKPDAPEVTARKTLSPTPAAPPVSAKAPVATKAPALAANKPAVAAKAPVARPQAAKPIAVAPPRAPKASVPATAKPAVLAQIKPKQIAVPANSPEARAAAAAKAAYEKGEEAPATQAKTQTIGGKPRFLGLMLTSLLLIFMAVVAAVAYWSDPADDLIEPALPEARENLSLGAASEDAPALQAEPIEAAPPVETSTSTSAPPDQISSLDPGPDASLETIEPSPETPSLSTTDSAALDLLAEEASPQIDQPADQSDAERALRTSYAATGIWQQPPSLDAAASLQGLDDIYVASIDNAALSHDAIALPNRVGFNSDLIQTALPSPAPADSRFDLDERGLVIATPEGTLNPDGITVYLGRPNKVPPPAPVRPLRAAPVQTSNLALARPRLRPVDLQERAERARFDGRSRAELAKFRPRLRPISLAPPAAPEAIAAEVEETIAALVNEGSAPERSVIPRKRPDTLAKRTEPRSVAAAVTTPRIPSNSSVAREATVRGAINLRELNLIGISGSSRNREALVRLPSGRLKKLKVGDSIDGGRVTAIDEQRLLYQKRGRNHTLRMPNG